MTAIKSAFEQHGWFEQLYDPAEHRLVGLRKLDAIGDRRVGYAGEIAIEVVGKITVQNGAHPKVVNFRKKTKLLSIIYPICGRRI